MAIDVITENNLVVNVTPDNQYPGVRDLRVVESEPASNFGDSPEIDLEVTKFGNGDHNHTLMWFDISQVPNDATISDARLYLYQSGGNDAYDIAIRELLVEFSQLQCTWNISSTGVPWNTPGALGAGVDRVSVPTSITNIPNINSAWYTFDLTQLTIDRLAAGAFGIHLERADTGNDQTFKVFRSSNAATGLRPELVITYTVGQPTITITNLQPNTEVRIYNAGTTTELAGIENTTGSTFSSLLPSGTLLVDVVLLSLPFENERIRNVSTSTDVTLSVNQDIDRQYENP